MSVLLSKDQVYFTLQPHPQLLTSCMIGTPRFCMLVMIHFTSIGIWACCTSLAKFSSVIPTEDIEIIKTPMSVFMSVFILHKVRGFTSIAHNVVVVNNRSVFILTSFVYNIEQNDADFVICHDVLVQKNWNDISHVIFDLLPFRICSHCQVLKIVQNKRVKHSIYI